MLVKKIKKIFEIFVVIEMISFLGCAKPNYVQSGGSNLHNSGQNEKLSPTGPCSMRLEKMNLCMQTSWLHFPEGTKDAGRLLLKIYRPNLADLSPVPMDVQKEVKVFLWMPSMNHGSAPVRLVQKDIGTYEVDKIYFIMKGDWEIRIQFLENNQVQDESKLSLIF